MRKIIFFLFIFITGNVSGQVIDAENKIYDLFDFTGSGYLTGTPEDRYYPASGTFSPYYNLNFKMNYHDVYREWSADNNYKASYQYDMGINAGVPLVISGRNFTVNIELMKKNLSSVFTGKNSTYNFNTNNRGTYSINSGVLFDGGKNKAGMRLKYSTGNNGAQLNINQYPSDESNDLLNKYLFDLLEPALGNEFNLNLASDEISYAAEYKREVGDAFQLGINVYGEINNQNIDIQYFGSVENLTGQKYLNGLLAYSRYSFGLTMEYSTGRIQLRSLFSHAVPEYKLNIDQNNSLVKNNVNLEIKNLADGNCNGNGNALGLGMTYKILEGLNLSFSYKFIGSFYSGNLKASTPVLGYEILPIAHQLQTGFSDKMRNNLVSLNFYHKPAVRWDYSIEFQYLSSRNYINYNYRVLTEFGIGEDKEIQSTVSTLNLYKIDLTSQFGMTELISIKFLFTQYIPVIKGKSAGGNSSKPSPPDGGTVKSKISNWGGSIYGLSLVYNFN